MKTLNITAPDACVEEITNIIKEKFPTVKISVHKTANETIKEVIDCLNKNCGTSFKATSKATQGHISARIAEGYTLDDFRHVICFKNDEWGSDPKMSVYLRPETLFGTKFEGYLMAAKKDLEPIQQQPRLKYPEVAL